MSETTIALFGLFCLAVMGIGYAIQKDAPNRFEFGFLGIISAILFIATILDMII